MVRVLLDVATLCVQLDFCTIRRKMLAQDRLSMALTDHPGVDLCSSFLASCQACAQMGTYEWNGRRRLAWFDGIVRREGLHATRQLVVPERFEGDTHLPHFR